MDFVILFHCEECYFNPHMHKMSPLQGLKNYFWQPILLEKYQNRQIPRVPDKKHNFTWSTRTHKNLWILFLFSLSYLGPIIGTKITISYEFTPLQAEVYHMFSAWNLGFSHFLSKTDGWKYIVWDPWLPLLSCLYSDVSLKKHTNVPNQTVKL